MLRHVVLPLIVAGGSYAADASPIRDVRVGFDVGFARRTDLALANDTVHTAADTTPLTFSLAYVRGIGGSAAQSPLLGVRLSYERGSGATRTGASSGHLDGEALALDAEAGWAARLPDAPQLHVEAAFSLGYREESDRLGFSQVGGHGYESSARLSLIRTDADGWQLGATLSYLFESAVEMADISPGSSARVTSRGAAFGIVLGRRL